MSNKTHMPTGQVTVHGLSKVEKAFYILKVKKEIEKERENSSNFKNICKDFDRNFERLKGSAKEAGFLPLDFDSGVFYLNIKIPTNVHTYLLSLHDESIEKYSWTKLTDLARAMYQLRYHSKTYSQIGISADVDKHYAISVQDEEKFKGKDPERSPGCTLLVTNKYGYLDRPYGHGTQVSRLVKLEALHSYLRGKQNIHKMMAYRPYEPEILVDVTPEMFERFVVYDILPEIMGTLEEAPWEKYYKEKNLCFEFLRWLALNPIIEKQGVFDLYKIAGRFLDYKKSKT